MLADFALLTIEPDRDQTALVVTQPFGLFDPVVQTKQHDETKRDARNAAGQEQPLPARKAKQAIRIVEDQSGDRRADDPRESGREQEPGVIRPRVFRKPERQVVENPGRKAGFRGAEQKRSA